MMEGKRSKSCSNVEVELDRISNLPNEIIGRILSSLPMEEGVRTSVLSSKWRYKWAMVPHLVFDHLCPANTVDRVLLSHIGPISKFQISRRSKDVDDLDRWILPISRHPIKELILKCHAEELYKLPLCVFSCQELIHLHLKICLLKPPPTFNGFSSLKRLHFEFVAVAQDVLEHMIVCCHLLERLTLIFCKGIAQLKIDAPNLQEFLCIDYLDDLSFVNTPNFAVVDIPFSKKLVSYGSSELLKFFSDLPKVQSLHISGWVLNFIAGGALVEELPKSCLHLKSLEMGISFGEAEHVSIVICLMRSSPALETLKIYQDRHDQAYVGAVNSWLDKYRSCSFTKLRDVEIKGIAGVEAELDFIRFLLVSSPVLQTMTVVFQPPEPDTDDGTPGHDTDDETLNLYQECEDQAGAEAVNYWLDKNQSCSLTQLRHVKIQGISGEAELDFIRFLLISSPVLETVTVVFRPPWPDTDDGSPDLDFLKFSLDVVKKLLRFRRASLNVEIICVDAERLNLDAMVTYIGP